MTKRGYYVVIMVFVALLIGVFVLFKNAKVLKSPVKELVPTPTAIEITLIPTLNITQAPTTAVQWKTYSNKTYGFTVNYPSNWQKKEEQTFESGDLLAVMDIGKAQKPQTELSDGAIFSIMKPVTTKEDLVVWVKTRYEKSAEVNPDSKPKYSEATIGGKTYQQVEVCGLGCATYLHIKEMGRVFGFFFMSEGPNKAYYESIFRKIQESLKFQ